MPQLFEGIFQKYFQNSFDLDQSVSCRFHKLNKRILNKQNASKIPTVGDYMTIQINRAEKLNEEIDENIVEPFAALNAKVIIL